MERAAPSRETGIALALRLANGGLRERLAAAIDATPDLHRTEPRERADIVVVDGASFDPDEPALAGVVLLIGEPESALPLSVRAILPEDASPAMVIDAVRMVSHGLFVLPESALDRGSWMGADDDEAEATQPLTNGAAADHDHPASPVTLTPREHEVLQLLAAGASNKLIARRLGISVHTAKFHVASLLRKLGASGRLEAIGIGLRTGLLMV